MWAKTSRFGIVGVVGLVLLAGCGSGSNKPQSGTPTSSSASSYPAKYKEDYLADNHCGTSEGDSTSSCECQVKYIEAHVPWGVQEVVSEQPAARIRVENVMSEASSHCLESSEHTPAEETAHNSAVEGEQKYQELKEQKEREDQPEEEKLQKIKEKVEYEAGQ